MIRFVYLMNVIASIFYVEIMKYLASVDLKWLVAIMAVAGPFLLWTSSKDLRSTLVQSEGASEQATKDAILIGCLLFIVYFCLYMEGKSEADKYAYYYAGIETVMIWFVLLGD